MTSMKTFLLGAVMTGMMAAPLAAMAQDAAAIAPVADKTAEKPVKRDHGAKAFESFDSNKDGAIDLDEFLARHKAKFKEIDSNNDEKISNDEFAAHGDKMREKMKEFREKRTQKNDAKAPVEGETGDDTAE